MDIEHLRNLMKYHIYGVILHCFICAVMVGLGVWMTVDGTMTFLVAVSLILAIWLNFQVIRLEWKLYTGRVEDK